MKKSLMIIALTLGFFGCQTAENTNVVNKNTNANYNQNTEIQKIRNQLKQQATNQQKDINAVQEQFEKGTSNVTNSNNSNNSTNNSREKLHNIEPETR